MLLTAAVCAGVLAAAAPGEDKPEMERGTITVLLYEGVPAAAIAPLLPELEKTFGLSFRIAEGARKPHARAFDAKRGQYRAAAVLKDVADAKPKRAVRVLGVMSEDFYVKDWNFALGLASPKNAAAVVSLFRLRTDDEARFKTRLLTEMVHELGHTFGLRHCESAKCAMRFSNRVGQVDAKGPALCGSCSRKLRKAVEALGEK